MSEQKTPGLSHINTRGEANMVDVGDKPVTARVAVAEAFVRVNEALAGAIRSNSLAKGDLFAVARIAGVQAAKRTDELIPLCHQLPLDKVDVEVELLNGRVRVMASARTHAKTGVEMEALTAVAVAALTIIDMGKALDKGMVIEGLRVIEKRGGRSGDYHAEGGA
ncbi:MAG: cyclic pyranopterin monophosphate synthase MoaC [Planctomycetes bacterium]|nr:cyclic pyranopterin monophosphate synthase MoaC [Planctomycetota bacterium]